MLTNEDKKQILESFLETVDGISDKEYQKKIWIRGEGPECDDFTETTCHFFEEVDGILQKHADFGININQYKLITKLRDQFNEFLKEPRHRHLPQEFIGSPEWNRITNLAKQVLKAFNYPSNSKSKV